MKRLLSLVAVLAMLAFAGSAQATAVSVLMNAQSAAGAGSAVVTATGGTGVENFTFQYIVNVTGIPVTVPVQLELSLDSGTTWAPVHLFGKAGGQSEIFTFPICGVCRIRANKLSTTTGTAKVVVSCSGAASCVAP